MPSSVIWTLTDEIKVSFCSFGQEIRRHLSNDFLSLYPTWPVESFLSLKGLNRTCLFSRSIALAKEAVDFFGSTSSIVFLFECMTYSPEKFNDITSNSSQYQSLQYCSYFKCLFSFLTRILIKAFVFLNTLLTQLIKRTNRINCTHTKQTKLKRILFKNCVYIFFLMLFLRSILAHA